MLQTFVVPELRDRNLLHTTIFQQDGARPHTAGIVEDYLRAQFTDDRVISLGFPTEWPPRSPDLTPCDYWLWSHLKEIVYRQRPAPSFDVLRQRIEAAVESITPEHLTNAVYHSVLRCQAVLECNGGRIQQILK